ncbi:MAG: hypothetical protein CMB99_02110 [Flavobacteriaceae bacterium]|nr:hypothetical protein [Flavobacteriaceae bacterium]|tara:strand:+ start:8832 stop:9809 length:978 start_codon:yes stop_codon:yes gene_type:complete
MPRIYYTANNYTNPFDHINTNGENFIRCRKLDLYRSIITVGSPTFVSWRAIRQNGLFRTISTAIIQKALMVQTNIQSNQNGMYLHPIFNGYVSDQKRIVSYNLGMAFAKIYAERLLNIPNLTHLETLKKINAVTFVKQSGKSKEPDLVGMTSNGNWHVFEAKGMSSNKLSSEIIVAKNQANQIATIHGQAPTTLSACATYFGSNRIVSLIEDPESGEEKNIEVKKDKFYEGYYNSFFAFRELMDRKSKKEQFENIDFQSFDIRTNQLNITIGLETEVYELLQEKNYSLIDEFYASKRNTNEIVEVFDRENISIGQDGFIVKYLNY